MVNPIGRNLAVGGANIARTVQDRRGHDGAVFYIGCRYVLAVAARPMSKVAICDLSERNTLIFTINTNPSGSRTRVIRARHTAVE